MGNRYFQYYDIKYAEAITLSGQLSIRWIENKINQYLNKLLGTDDDYILAVDTDSVVGDTIININDKQISIQDFFDSIDDQQYIKYDDFNDHYVKEVLEEVITPSINKNGDIENKKIKYIMKHKVTKELFKIKNNNGDEVIVTEDHSIIIRNKQTNKIEHITPKKLDPEIHEIINIMADTDSKGLNG